MFRYDGHSGGVTPGPIPNPAVKSARVSVCTVLRKRTGTQVRCQPLYSFDQWFVSLISGLSALFPLCFTWILALMDIKCGWICPSKLQSAGIDEV